MAVAFLIEEELKERPLTTYTRTEVDQMREAIRASLPASVTAYNPERAEMLLQSYLIAGVSPWEVFGVEPMQLKPETPPTPLIEPGWYIARRAPIGQSEPAGDWNPVLVAVSEGDLYVRTAGSITATSTMGWQFKRRLNWEEGK